MRALSLEATPRKNVNVLQHAMGYFKRRFAEPCLARQIWLNPHPVELAPANHV